MFDQRWPTVYDGGPTLVKHWLDGGPTLVKRWANIGQTLAGCVVSARMCSEKILKVTAVRAPLLKRHALTVGNLKNFPRYNHKQLSVKTQFLYETIFSVRDIIYMMRCPIVYSGSSMYHIIHFIAATIKLVLQKPFLHTQMYMMISRKMTQILWCLVRVALWDPCPAYYEQWIIPLSWPLVH